MPKGEVWKFRTKNSTESKFGTDREFVKKGSKTLRKELGNARFPREKEQENATDSKNATAVAKYYGFEGRSIFSAAGSFGL